MPRLTNLDDVLFPVEEHPVFVDYADKKGERRLPVPSKKAIVNTTNGHVLGIVSRDYRLVKNREALEMAQQCCRTVFPETKPGEWAVKATDAPSTAGYCHIDLLHNSTALDFDFVPADQRPEAFGPFIRVTNSYNGLRALGFDIGYYRKVCQNGLILPQSIISFKFNHSNRDIGKSIEFKIAQNRLADFKTSFTNSLGVFRAFAVPRSQFVPLIRAVLLIQPPQSLKPATRKTDDWEQLGAHLEEISNRYAGELGENAYAVFNAITDFASHPPENRCVHRDRQSLQCLSGSWFTSFAASCGDSSFSISSHLEQLGKQPVESKQHLN